MTNPIYGLLFNILAKKRHSVITIHDFLVFRCENVFSVEYATHPPIKIKFWIRTKWRDFTRTILWKGTPHFCGNIWNLGWRDYVNGTRRYVIGSNTYCTHTNSSNTDPYQAYVGQYDGMQHNHQCNTIVMRI